MYINVLVGYGNSKGRTKIYAHMYTLVYLLSWANFKIKLVIGTIQFEPPETLQMGKTLMVVLRRFSTVVHVVKSEVNNI